MRMKLSRSPILLSFTLLLVACAGNGSNNTGRCTNHAGYYCVQSGDTLYRISQRFNVSVAALKSMNNLRGDTIYRGQSLRVSKNTRATNTHVAAKTQSLQWPLKGNILKDYGSSNRGIDIAAPAGSSIVASGDGKVIYAGDGIRGYGNLLLIKHSDTLLTAYANNDRLLVGENARVKAGQAIATVGNSGRSDGETALHFEVRVNGKAVNPYRYLPTQ